MPWSASSASSICWDQFGEVPGSHGADLVLTVKEQFPFCISDGASAPQLGDFLPLEEPNWSRLQREGDRTGVSEVDFQILVSSGTRASFLVRNDRPVVITHFITTP